MIQDVVLRTFSTYLGAQNQVPGLTTSSNNIASLNYWLFSPATISAQITSSLPGLTAFPFTVPSAVSWFTSATILRYVQIGPKTTWLPPGTTLIEHIPNCIMIQFALTVDLELFSPTYGEVEALATANIFIES